MASFGNLSPIMGNANQILSAPSALQQVGPGSPSFQPGSLPPMAVPQAPQMAPAPGAQPVPNAMPQAPQAPMGQQAGVVGMPPSNPEAFAIIKALSSRLSSLSKGEEMKANPGGLQ